MRMLMITLAASIVTFGVILNAYSKKHQFFPTVVYLVSSNRSMSVLYIQVSLLLWQLIKIFKFIFFGTLRAIEVEHLIEKSWFAVLDTFILLAAFHEEMNPKFVSLVVLLFIAKSFHWLSSDRIDHMEQSPVITWKFHIRAIVLLLILGAIDVFFVQRAWFSLKTRGLSVDIVFGLEYAIMLTEAMKTLMKYILHTIDLRNENPWENKPIYIRYVDIVLGIIELLLYAGYMVFMLMVPFIPLHIARRVYRAARDFHKSVHDVIASHQAIRNLNTLYSDATPEELQTANNVCIICREEMLERCKKLPCGHTFHTSCLRSWFQRQHTCPTCRLDVLRNTGQPHPLVGGAQAPPQRRDGQGNQGQVPPFVIPPQMMMGGAWQQAPPPQAPQPNPQVPPPAMTPPNTPPQNAENATGGGGVPPQFVPPFPAMPPFFFPPPPPLIDAQNDEFLKNVLRNLTEDQLRELEGMERANVEARILLLRNIQQLLDAAVLKMSQYSNVMSSLNLPLGQMFPPQPTPAGTTEPVITATGPADTSGTVDTSNVSIEDPVDTPTEDNTTDHGETGSFKTPSVDIPDSELIRQRRLQRFHSLPVSSLSTDLSLLEEKETENENERESENEN